jgi:DNA-binding winged helix-turn-helix (wHTH) protein
MPFREKALYHFGHFRLDAGQGLLHADGELIPLAPKAFETLLAVVESQGRVLEKEELLKRVWPDAFVEEGSLAQNVSILRKALGEGTNGQQYIQTLPKRGYRFVAPVTVSNADDRVDVSTQAVEQIGGGQATKSHSLPYRGYVLVGAALIALAVGLAGGTGTRLLA